MRAGGYIVVVLLIGLCSCAPRRVLVHSDTTDSVRIVREVEYVERLRDTTIYIPVPAESREATIRRDSSHLETSVAISLARINSDGTLFHSLANKAGRLSVPVQIRDTEKIENTQSQAAHIVTKEVPVKLPLSWWERFWCTCGKVGWGILLVIVVGWVMKRRLI